MGITKPLCLAASSAVLLCSTGASAQSFDILPHPMDRLNGPPQRLQGACGKDYYNDVGEEVQKLYKRHGRCGNFSKSKYSDYVIWVKKHDPDDGRDYGSGALGDYENVPSYFAWMEIDWWDGRTSPGYEEVARYGSQLAPGLVPTFPLNAGSVPDAGTPTRKLARASGVADGTVAEMARLQGADAYRPAASEFADGGEPGACGVPYLDEDGRSYQAFLAEEGGCAEYVEEVEAEGY